MGFWIFMLIMNLLIPVTMLAFGKIFMNKAPGTINMAYGYRTTMSMKNQETWDFAHKYAGALWFKWGIWLTAITVAVMLLLIGKDEDFIGNVGAVICMIQMIPLIGVIAPTERALKRRFDEKGNRRNKNTTSAATKGDSGI